MFGLGLAVGAVLHGEARAQQPDTTRAGRDTTRAARDTTREVRVPVPPREDSLIRRDSAGRRQEPPRAPRDSVKAPIAAFEAPVLADAVGNVAWSRRDMFSTGALTVQDLLDRIPGLTSFRGGWIAQPMSSAYLGDPNRVRIFLDGLELIELDPRAERVWDLSQIPLWALDDIRIERGASEIRIHMRSWRVERTAPFTRTDVYTGDQSTNLYRGLFGRRYGHGEILQFAGQQHGTDPGRTIESSDQLGLLARVGIARERWSLDGFVLRSDRDRGRTVSENLADTIPTTESTRTDAYLRAGWGSTLQGPWVQALALSSKYTFGGATVGGLNSDAADTIRYESQYLLAGGYALGPWRASFTQRFRTGLERRIATPAARLGYETSLLTVSALAEGRGVDSTRRVEASAVVRPLDFIFVAGSYGIEKPRPLPDSLRPVNQPADPTFMRAEAGVRLFDVWLSGGATRRDAVVLDAPRLFRNSTETVVDGPRQGLFAAVRGRLWKALYIDAQGIQWADSGGLYRPRYQTRGELYLSTSLPERYPSGNLHILASASHEYRSSMLWPDSSGVLRVKGYRTVSTLVQFRILSAEVFWNFRNILGERYEQIPGFRATRQSNIYGVRWEFWN